MVPVGNVETVDAVETRLQAADALGVDVPEAVADSVRRRGVDGVGQGRRQRHVGSTR